MFFVPVHASVSDIVIFLRGDHTPEDYFRMVCDQFDTLYQEGAPSGSVVVLLLHPFYCRPAISIKYLDKVLVPRALLFRVGASATRAVDDR